MSEPMIGDFGLTKISGITGAAINVGQWFIGDFAPVQHALVYVGDGLVVQAMPDGAEVIPLEDASPVVKWSTGLIDLTGDERDRIRGWALRAVGTPYGWLDYLSIALANFHVRPKLISEYIESGHTLICSQLVDWAYDLSGVYLFDDGRLTGDVTPGDLWKLLKDKEQDV